MNMFKKLWLLILTLAVVSCGAPPTEERTAQVSSALYSHTPGTTQLYWSTPGPTGIAVRFALWLPPQFDGVAQMPLLVWLHGKQSVTANPDQVVQQQANQVVPALSSAISTGKIRPTMIAFPWGGAESWYNDSCSGTYWPIETMLIQEFIPDLEANLPVFGDREHRLMGGFSMGGHGALKFAAKYPSMFLAVVSGAAPKPDPSTAQWPTNELAGYQAAFCSSPTNFAASAPLTQYQNNVSVIQGLPMETRMIVGGADGTRIALNAFKNKLINQLGFVLNGNVEYREYAGIGHQQGPLLTADGGASFQFLEGLMP